MSHSTISENLTPAFLEKSSSLFLSLFSGIAGHFQIRTRIYGKKTAMIANRAKNRINERIKFDSRYMVASSGRRERRSVAKERMIHGIMIEKLSLMFDSK
jgi:hypothetical protein